MQNTTMSWQRGPPPPAAAPRGPPPKSATAVVLQQWGKSCADAYAERNGGNFAGALLACPTDRKVNVNDQMPLHWPRGSELRHALVGLSGGSNPYIEICALWAEANNYETSAEMKLQLLNAAFDRFADVFTQKRPEGPRDTAPVGWDIAVLVILVRRVRDAARAPEAELSEDQLGAIFRSWRKVFIFAQTADESFPNNVARRRGALAVLNGLISILLLNHNWTQVKALLQSIEQAETLAAGDVRKGVLGPCGHMTSEVIRLHYHRGRFNLFEQNPSIAFLAFRQAFFLMPPLTAPDRQMVKNIHDNKLRVAFYWIIAGLLCGMKPPEILLRQQNRSLATIFAPIVAALDSGNEAMLLLAIEDMNHVFMSRGVLMLMNTLRRVCLVVLLKRISAALTAEGHDGSRIPLSVVMGCLQADYQDAFGAVPPVKAAEPAIGNKKPRDEADDADYVPTKRAREDPAEPLTAAAHASDRSSAAVRRMLLREAPSCTLDETSVRIASLITRGAVRGYLIHSHGMLVVSKKEPFPPNELFAKYCDE